MLKGIFNTIIYYSIGLVIAGIFYLVFGIAYVHAPSPHHIAIFLTFVGGTLWLIGATVKFFTGGASDTLKGIIFTNLVAVALFVGYIYYDIYQYNGSHSDQEATLETEIQGDTTIIRHNGNLLYLKVGDSVYINFIDSAAFDLK